MSVTVAQSMTTAAATTADLARSKASFTSTLPTTAVSSTTGSGASTLTILLGNHHQIAAAAISSRVATAH